MHKDMYIQLNTIIYARTMNTTTNKYNTYNIMTKMNNKELQIGVQITIILLQVNIHVHAQR